MIVNTHFDHRGSEARRQSAAVLRRYARQFAANHPLIVTGDFNAGEGSDPYRELIENSADAETGLVDVYRIAQPARRADEGTFNGFRGLRDGPRIDWILATPSWRVVSARIVTTQREGRFPSDHFPVVAELEYGADTPGE